MTPLLFMFWMVVCFLIGFLAHWIASLDERGKLKRYRRYYQQQRVLEKQRRLLEHQGPE